MGTDLSIATWGVRQTFAILVAIGSIIVGAGLIRPKPGASDMAAAARLTFWRKAIMFVPSAAYLWFAAWRRPPASGAGNIVDYVFGDFALYDPIAYVVIVVVSIVAGTDLTGGRALRLAVSALGGVVLLFVGLFPIVLGLHVLATAITGG